MQYDAFISYNVKDADLAIETHRRLTEAKLNVWLDRERLEPACNWYECIAEGVENSRFILPILTPRWSVSKWTKFETYGAEAIVSLFFEGDWEKVAPAPLRPLQRIDLRTMSEKAWGELIKTLHKLRAAPLPERSARMMYAHFPPNPHFVAREAELIEIHERLFRGVTPDATQGGMFVLTGGPGLGKTSLARQYVEKFWRCYRQIFWIDCRADLISQFARLAERLLPNVAGLTEKTKADRAFDELSQPRIGLSRLLVLDDALNEGDVQSWVPKTGNCHTIVTAHFAAWCPTENKQQLCILEREPARKFLLDRTRRDCSGGNLAACDKLAEALGYLPLALEQAAAYIERQEPAFDFADYLRLFSQSEAKFLQNPAPGATEYPRSVYSTWQLAIEKLSVEARALLRLTAFFAPASIPIQLLFDAAPVLAECATKLDGQPRPENANETNVRDWKDELIGYSMARYESDVCIAVHGPVQVIERDQVKLAEREFWSGRAMKATAGFAPVPADQIENWPPWSRLLPHAKLFWEREDENHDDRPVSNQSGVIASGLFAGMASYLFSQGRSIEAEAPARQAVTVDQRELGEFGESTLVNLDLLATILRSNGNFPESEKLYRRVCALCEQSLAPQHALNIVIKSHLAGLLAEMGQHAEAEDLYRRGLEICQAVRGEDHRDTFEFKNNLGSLLQDMGRHAEAEPLHSEAFIGYTKTTGIGLTHPDTVRALNNLGTAIEGQGRLEEAVPLYRNALEACIKTLSNEHPLTLTCLNNFMSAMRKLPDTFTGNSQTKDAVAKIAACTESLFQKSAETKSLHLGLQGMISLYGAVLAQAGHSQEEVQSTISEMAIRNGFEIGTSSPDGVGSK
jgi:tetratricopeptide (TPR) repeat protein